MTQKPPTRCAWVNPADPLMTAYHDSEWGVPVHDDRKHFEFLVLEAAQAGPELGDRVEEAGRIPARLQPVRSREGGAIHAGTDREAHGRSGNRPQPDEDPGGSAERARVPGGPGGIRQLRRLLLAVRRRPAPRESPEDRRGEIPATSPESDAFSKDLKTRGFAFVGSTIVYAHMQAVGMVNDHLVRCFRYRETQRR